VYPSLTYRDVGAAVTWLAEAFGFDGHALGEAGAIIRSGDGTAIVQTDRPGDLHGSHIGHGWVYVPVAGIGAHYARAKAAGASLLGEPRHYGDGYRGYSARDLEGNLWSFGTGPRCLVQARAGIRGSPVMAQHD
jgi:uncharacterized glyoxalase superfamily protein PhnB